jgi:hypothetical protein
MLGHLEVLHLILDEVVDDGIILELDGQAVANRASMRCSSAGKGVGPFEHVDAYQTPRQALSEIKNRINSSLKRTFKKK